MLHCLTSAKLLSCSGCCCYSLNGVSHSCAVSKEGKRCAGTVPGKCCQRNMSCSPAAGKWRCQDSCLLCLMWESFGILLCKLLHPLFLRMPADATSAPQLRLRQKMSIQSAAPDLRRWSHAASPATPPLAHFLGLLDYLHQLQSPCAREYCVLKHSWQRPSAHPYPADR